MRQAGFICFVSAIVLLAGPALGQQIEMPEVYVSGRQDQVERLNIYRELDLPDHFRPSLAKLIEDRNLLYQSRDEKVELMFQEFYEKNAALFPAGLAQKIDRIDAALVSFDDEALRARNETVWALKLEAYGGDIRTRKMRQKFAAAQFNYHAAMVEWDETNPGSPAEASRIVGRLSALDFVIGGLLYKRGEEVEGVSFDNLFRIQPLPYPEAIVPAEFQSDYQEHQTLYSELIVPETNDALIACLNDRFNTTNRQREIALYDQLEASEEKVASLDNIIRQKSVDLRAGSPKDDMEGYLALKRELTDLRKKRSANLWEGRRTQVAIWGTEVGRSARRTFLKLHKVSCDPTIEAKLTRLAEINFQPRIQEAYPALKDVPLPVIYDISYRGARLTAQGYGTIEIAFLADEAPAHVENFIKLVRSGFYDGTTFHRVMTGFTVQGGDPNTKDDNPNNDGVGDPGYKQRIENGPSRNLKGYVGAAQYASILQNKNTPPEDAGSQFYILLTDSPHLDREGSRSTIFARVVGGMEVLDRIGGIEVDPKMRPLREIRVTFSLVK